MVGKKYCLIPFPSHDMYSDSIYFASEKRQAAAATCIKVVVSYNLNTCSHMLTFVSADIYDSTNIVYLHDIAL